MKKQLKKRQLKSVWMISFCIQLQNMKRSTLEALKYIIYYLPYTFDKYCFYKWAIFVWKNRVKEFNNTFYSTEKFKYQNVITAFPANHFYLFWPIRGICLMRFYFPFLFESKHIDFLRCLLFFSMANHLENLLVSAFFWGNNGWFLIVKMELHFYFKCLSIFWWQPFLAGDQFPIN